MTAAVGPITGAVVAAAVAATGPVPAALVVGASLFPIVQLGTKNPLLAGATAALVGAAGIGLGGIGLGGILVPALLGLLGSAAAKVMLFGESPNRRDTLEGGLTLSANRIDTRDG